MVDSSSSEILTKDCETSLPHKPRRRKIKSETKLLCLKSENSKIRIQEKEDDATEDAKKEKVLNEMTKLTLISQTGSIKIKYGSGSVN